MQRFSKFLWLWFAVLFVPAWFLQKHLEATGNSDYLGNWYTAYCGACYTVLALGAIGLFLLFGIRFLKRRG